MFYLYKAQQRRKALVGHFESSTHTAYRIVYSDWTMRRAQVTSPEWHFSSDEQVSLLLINCTHLLLHHAFQSYYIAI